MISALQSVNSAASGVDTHFASASPLSAAASASDSAGQGPFGDLLKDAVGHANQLEEQARAAITGLMTGTGVDVHQAMIASEKASMAFEMVLAVRNKAIQSYQSVMSMQF
jgi:flagellar hook-basal body complex protein FliE